MGTVTSLHSQTKPSDPESACRLL